MSVLKAVPAELEKPEKARKSSVKAFPREAMNLLPLGMNHFQSRSPSPRARARFRGAAAAVVAAHPQALPVAEQAAQLRPKAPAAVRKPPLAVAAVAAVVRVVRVVAREAVKHSLFLKREVAAAPKMQRKYQSRLCHGFWVQSLPESRLHAPSVTASGANGA